ncbi:MAG: YggT family protein [Lachnospiraceae bacterium]
MRWIIPSNHRRRVSCFPQTFGILDSSSAGRQRCLLIYCLLSYIAPGSRVMEFLRPHMEGILYPFRQLLYKWFPQLMNSPVDFSPLAVWLVIDILLQLLRMLQRAL